jgi:ribosomal protein L12E/L44/L45/RPP1/RPP2
MMIDVVKKNGMLIEYIDKHMLTPLLVSEAVRQNGLAIQYIDDEEYLTHSVILDAIQSDPDAIDWIANEEIAKIIKNLVNGPGPDPMDQGALAKEQTSEEQTNEEQTSEEQTSEEQTSDMYAINRCFY